MDLADIARMLGRPVPVWLDGTTTSTNGEQSLSYDSTFVVPDTITNWPAARDRLASAVQTEMAGEYPAGFAALAVDTAETLSSVRARLVSGLPTRPAETHG